ncbi:hypothetical protein HYS31_08555 [Candidatus Woesearchaeota archaeon]|nr:hypothetical protein [Candidatus Woesearchaeota archaeon]
MGKEERGKQWTFWVWITIILVVILGYFKVPNTITQKIIGFIVLGPLIGIITSYIVALYVGKLTGNSLKKGYFYIENFFGYDFSISVFAVVTFILEILIFS